MAISIILIFLLCYVIGFSPLYLFMKIGKGFFALVGLWIIVLIILCIQASVFL